MSKHKETKSFTADEMFSDFVQSCKEHFAFLETEFGLSLIEDKRFGYEYRVLYGNSDYNVKVYLEYPSQPWIQIEKRENQHWKRKGLHQLYKRVFKKDMPSIGNGNATFGDPYDLTNLPILGDIMKNHWDELVAAL